MPIFFVHFEISPVGPYITLRYKSLRSAQRAVTASKRAGEFKAQLQIWNDPKVSK